MSNDTKPEMADEIADMLTISGECAQCDVVQECLASTLLAASQELERIGWIVKDGELLCYGCAGSEN